MLKSVRAILGTLGTFGISIVVICVVVLVRYGNSLSSTYGGSAGLVLGHDIAPSKLLEGLTLPALHWDFSPVCVLKQCV